MSKRIQHRTGSGQFRQSSLADIGMGCCDKCGGIFTPQLDDLREQPFIDPAEFRRRHRTCGSCLGLAGAETPTMFTAQK